ncbi:capsule assembly Wzi family protein [Larkinella humicola]|uniref:Capsule assembly Wzi family protein n=1 Tax=Larkinella humicola TaxID=2607654 RepID=A0A5N1JDR6_9BACT|nr:capsule assembly Wzi family protein [Larkinella humicola]KAA9353501.1 capsule assembly Wzi family protein [Larkinella humicola]
MKAPFCTLILLFLVSCPLYAQKPVSSVQVSAEVSGMASSARRTPFWLRANQFGTVPLIAPAGTVRLGSSGVFRVDSTGKGWHFGYGAEVVGYAGPNNRLLVPEAYAKIGYRSIELVVGRRKEVLGLVDTTLSSGSYSWSGNALPITKIQLGTNGYAPLKFTKGLISINAFFAHGWFPNTDSIQNSYLHQKALYGRIGKPNWKVKLYGGFLHNAQWGGKSKYLSSNQAVGGVIPSSFKTYLAVITASQPSNAGDYAFPDAVNRFGNHLGNIDIGTEISIKQYRILGYYQHPFEDKSGLALVNLPDGLYGIRIQNVSGQPNPFFKLKTITVEYLTTRDQSGATVKIDSRKYDGMDDYFNNIQYIDGWAVKERIIGTPFITRYKDTKPEWDTHLTPSKKNQGSMINNSLVSLYHIAVLGELRSGVTVEGRFSLSSNYGTHWKRFPGSVTQSSSLIRLNIPVSWLGGGFLGINLAMDQGDLYNDAIGGLISFKKVWH